jgi:hypothetical protein
LSKEKRKIFDKIRDIPEDVMDQSENDEEPLNYSDVLDGTVPLDISHGGGELDDLQSELKETLGKKKRSVKPFPYRTHCLSDILCSARHDTRRRWDKTEKRVLGFRGQMRAMTDSYIKWAAAHGEFGLDGGPATPDEENVDSSYKVNVIDVFGVCPSTVSTFLL